MGVGRIFRAAVALALFAGIAPASARAQNIATDGTLGPTRVLTGPNYTIGASLGKQVGGNLFQSFHLFGLNTGESATFTGPASVTNIIGRVTAGNLSSIDGLIRCSIAGANLFLINPLGIVFGPNATLNVSGGFHATTADYLKLADGAKFQATQPNGSTFSAAPPAAFGFMISAPAAIVVIGSSFAVRNSQTIGMVGGQVMITGGSLAAPGGTIHIDSAAGPGEIPVDPVSGPPATIATFGAVAITNEVLDVRDPTGSGNRGGTVAIRGGTIGVQASKIEADTHGSESGGQITMFAAGTMALGDGTTVRALAQGGGPGSDIVLATESAGGIEVSNAAVLVGGTAGGPGGLLSVTTGQLTVSDGASLTSKALGTASGGVIAINAGTVVLDGGASLDRGTGIFTTTTGPATGGSINLLAGVLDIRHGAEVLATSSGTGGGGAVNIAATGSLTVVSGASLGTMATAEGNAGSVSVKAVGPLVIDMGLAAISSTLDGIGSIARGAGNAGNISVVAGASTASAIADAGDLSIAANGAIWSGTFGSGAAGNIAVSVSGQLTIDGGRATSTSPTGIFSVAELKSSGTAGAVTVNAGGLKLFNRGAIASATFGFGNANNVVVSVIGALSLTSDAQVLADSERKNSGNAGSVAIAAGELLIAKNATISSTTFGGGAGGSVSVSVSHAFVIDGSRAFKFVTGIQTGSHGSGPSGNIAVQAGQLSIIGNAGIDAATFGPGQGGSVFVAVTGLIAISASATIAADSEHSNSGVGGSVTVTAGQLTIQSDGVISSGTFGRSSGGSVSVSVIGELIIDGTAGSPSVPTGILGQTDGAGGAGNITVQAGQLSIIGTGTITSGTRASGSGGSVSVTVSGLLLIDGSVHAAHFTGISAQSQGAGEAGSVSIYAGELSIAGGGEISSATQGSGNGGDVLVSVSDLLTIVGTPGRRFTSGITANAVAGSTGAAGAIVVAAGSLAISDTGVISSAAFGSGNGGSLSISVSGQLSIVGVPASAFTTGIFADAEPGSRGDAGNVTVTAGSLSIQSNAVISSSALGVVQLTRGQLLASIGNAGNVTVQVLGSLIINGLGTTALTGIATEAAAGTRGTAGELTVTARAMSIIGSGEVTSSTLGSGAGGDVSVNVGGLLSIDGAAGAASPPGIAAQSAGSGTAGSVTVVANELSLLDGGVISSATSGSSTAGKVSIDVTGLLVVDAASISAASLGANSGGAGSVAVQAKELSVAGGGEISSSTLGVGSGGSIAVTVGDLLTIDGASTSSNAPTGILSQAGGSGAAGSVTVSANRLMITSGGAISSSASGTGKGGDVTVAAGTALLTDAGPQITARSTGGGDAGNVIVNAGTLQIVDGAAISTAAATANGGNIAVMVGDLLYLQHGSITTSGTVGSGGNITLDPALIVLRQGSIIDASGGANGGNIAIRADAFIPEQGSLVTATGGTGISGTVAITGQQLGLSGSLITLPGDLRAPAAVLREACAGEGGRPRSSLKARGAVGVPPDLDAMAGALYLGGRDHAPLRPAPAIAGVAGARLARHCL